MAKSGRVATLALTTALVAGGARALPAPPYQSAEQMGAAPSQSLDRYGGGSQRVALHSPSQAGGRAAPAGPYLAWAGKAEAPTESSPRAPGGWTGMDQRWNSAPAAATASVPAPVSAPQTTMGPPSGGWRPAQAEAGAAPAARPASIYDTPSAPAAAPYRQARAPATPGGPRFYSLHRDYGIQPDAIPLPPQFFGATADLSTPPADPLVKRVTNASGQSRTVAVPDDQGAQ